MGVWGGSLILYLFLVVESGLNCYPSKPQLAMCPFSYEQLTASSQSLTFDLLTLFLFLNISEIPITNSAEKEYHMMSCNSNQKTIIYCYIAIFWSCQD